MKANLHTQSALSATGQELLTPMQQMQRFLELPLAPMIGLFALFITAFFNLVDISGENEDVSLDLQVLVKLAGLGLGGLYGGIAFLTNPEVRARLFSFPLIWMVMIFGLFCIAAKGSLIQTESLASALSIGCILLLTVAALVQLGVRATLNTVFHAMTLFIILSWVTFLLVPSIGVFQEPIPGGEFTARMSGLAHPNTLGQFSGMTVVLGLLLAQNYGYNSRWRWLIIALAFAALIVSLSRTSLAATLFACLFIYRDRVFQQKYVLPSIGLLIVGCMGLIVVSLSVDVGALIESKLTFLSKSGDAEELTSATGRADIWAYTIRLIGERPLTGYGAATSKFYLEDYSLYTHNMILNIAFSCGVFGGLIAIVMCLGRIAALVLHRHPLADPLVAFVLFNGLFENVIFSILAGLPTIIWIIGLCLPQLSLDLPDDQPVPLKQSQRSRA